MFLDEISIQTSIAIYVGLGFVFFLGFGYYFYRNPINNGQSVSWRILLGSIRGLILASLLVAILPFKIFKNINSKEPVEYIFMVDFPDSMITFSPFLNIKYIIIPQYHLIHHKTRYRLFFLSHHNQRCNHLVFLYELPFLT